MKKAVFLIPLVFLGACQTMSGGRPAKNVVTIESEPVGALVVIEGYGECETPCTISLDAQRMIRIAKPGYLAQRFGVSPGAKRVLAILEEAAPTEDVEAGALPDL